MGPTPIISVHNNITDDKYELLIVGLLLMCIITVSSFFVCARRGVSDIFDCFFISHYY